MDLDKLKALCDDPCTCRQYEDPPGYSCPSCEVLAPAARTALPELIEENERLEKLLERVRDWFEGMDADPHDSTCTKRMTDEAGPSLCACGLDDLLAEMGRKQKPGVGQ